MVEAARLLGAEPYLSEEEYRAELGRGRIAIQDLEAALDGDLGSTKDIAIDGAPITRGALRLALLLHPLARAEGQELAWLLAEASPIRARPDLWDAAVAAAPPPGRAPAPARITTRHRDLLLAVTGRDADALVHPLLIRLVAAYLDQGVAQWPMPDRDAGLRPALLGLLQASPPPAWWLAKLQEELRQEQELDPIASSLRSLSLLGVDPEEWPDFVRGTLLPLKGFAGMVHQLEVRPDRAPVFAPKVSLVELLAIRLLFDRLAIDALARDALDVPAPLDELRDRLRERLPAPDPPLPEEAAFLLFQIARILDWPAPLLRELGPARAQNLIDEVESFSELDRRRVFHSAYELHHTRSVLDAIAAHARAPARSPRPAAFQAVFCIDEREESIRRHLEETDPSAETFGIAGFFGVAMYYRGLEDAQHLPLCPIVLRPRHEVTEHPLPEQEYTVAWRKGARRVFMQLAGGWSEGSRTFGRGMVLTILFGAFAALPLVLQVLFPRLTGLLRRHGARAVAQRPTTRLLLERSGDAPVIGELTGFDTDEMAGIVRQLLEDTGLGRKSKPLAPIVFLLGHGSSSSNNPHSSAYDCGACGGSRGGPNARAFALMANDPEVRRRLRSLGLDVPDSVWFVGGEHDSANDSIRFFDLEALPEPAQREIERIMESFDRARALNAHERCRRFEQVPSWFPPALALAHVESRVEDLAQPRPELGHATNAVCIVGRRARTRDLYLDRRAFLVSYDPTADDAEGSILKRVLAAITPVGAGINLEYFFSRIDQVQYGAGTKLPHNVTGLLGVMDGWTSDLRTGLPKQMIEIHEPMRLLLVVETTPELLARAAASQPGVQRLVENGWMRVATLDPSSERIHLLENGRFVPYQPEVTELPEASSSAAWYRGHRDHLPCARIVPEAAPP